MEGHVKVPQSVIPESRWFESICLNKLRVRNEHKLVGFPHGTVHAWLNENSHLIVL